MMGNSVARYERILSFLMEYNFNEILLALPTRLLPSTTV